MQSCLYEGRVRHRRKGPPAHAFNFDLYLLCLDLDELTSVFRGRLLWSTNRRAFARFRESDYLREFGAQRSLRERVELVLSAHGVKAELGSVRLLTQLSYLGFSMNPVSFFYCLDPTGENVIAVIAEVNNTPWGEQHVYIVKGCSGSRNVVGHQIEKVFHVSPFMPMDMEYRMIFTPPGERLGVKIENYQDEKRVFDVSMLCEKKPITTWNLNRVLLAYPLISFKVIAGIYWHALRLFLKKVRFFPASRKRNSLERKSNPTKNRTKYDCS